MFEGLKIPESFRSKEVPKSVRSLSEALQAESILLSQLKIAIVSDKQMAKESLSIAPHSREIAHSLVKIDPLGDTFLLKLLAKNSLVFAHKGRAFPEEKEPLLAQVIYEALGEKVTLERGELMQLEIQMRAIIANNKTEAQAEKIKVPLKGRFGRKQREIFSEQRSAERKKGQKKSLKELKRMWRITIAAVIAYLGTGSIPVNEIITNVGQEARQIVKDLIQNSDNPNCIILAATIEERFNEKFGEIPNLIRGLLTDEGCEESLGVFALTDEHDFATPIDFTSEAPEENPVVDTQVQVEETKETLEPDPTEESPLEITTAFSELVLTPIATTIVVPTTLPQPLVATEESPTPELSSEFSTPEAVVTQLTEQSLDTPPVPTTGPGITEAPRVVPTVPPTVFQSPTLEPIENSAEKVVQDESLSGRGQTEEVVPPLVDQVIKPTREVPTEVLEGLADITSPFEAREILQELRMEMLEQRIEVHQNGVVTRTYLLPESIRNIPQSRLIDELLGTNLTTRFGERLPVGALAMVVDFPTEAQAHLGPFLWVQDATVSRSFYQQELADVYTTLNYPQHLLAEIYIQEPFRGSTFRPTDRITIPGQEIFVGAETLEDRVDPKSIFLCIDAEGKWQLRRYEDIMPGEQYTNLIWQFTQTNPEGEQEFVLPRYLVQQQRGQQALSLEGNGQDNVGPSPIFRTDVATGRSDILVVSPFLYLEEAELFAVIMMNAPMANDAIAGKEILVAGSDLHYVSNGAQPYLDEHSRAEVEEVSNFNARNSREDDVSIPSYPHHTGFYIGYDTSR